MKKIESDLKKLKEVNKKGLNRHFGESNPRWKGGSRCYGMFPCPQCGKERHCEKRNAYRKCWRCHINRPSEFSQKEWHKKTKEETKRWSVDYKGGKCVRCLVDDLPLPCYQFHHIDPTTKTDDPGHLMRQKPSKRLIKELDKCVLLCANCHAIITHTEEDLTALTYS